MPVVVTLTVLTCKPELQMLITKAVPSAIALAGPVGVTPMAPRTKALASSVANPSRLFGAKGRDVALLAASSTASPSLRPASSARMVAEYGQRGHACPELSLEVGKEDRTSGRIQFRLEGHVDAEEFGSTLGLGPVLYRVGAPQEAAAACSVCSPAMDAGSLAGLLPSTFEWPTIITRGGGTLTFGCH